MLQIEPTEKDFDMNTLDQANVAYQIVADVMGENGTFDNRVRTDDRSLTWKSKDWRCYQAARKLKSAGIEHDFSRLGDTFGTLRLSAPKDFTKAGAESHKDDADKRAEAFESNPSA